MEKHKLELLTGLAESLRKVLETVNKNALPITFKNFPAGSCGTTCLIFIKYLISKGFVAEEIYKVAGWKNGKSHAWLEIEDYIIDITADQFPGKNPIIITNSNKNWHQSFSVDQKYIEKFLHDSHEYDHYLEMLLPYLK